MYNKKRMMHFVIILVQTKNRNVYICLTLTHSNVSNLNLIYGVEFSLCSKQKREKLMAYQFTKVTVDEVAECHILTTIETPACYITRAGNKKHVLCFPLHNCFRTWLRLRQSDVRGLSFLPHFLLEHFYLLPLPKPILKGDRMSAVAYCEISQWVSIVAEKSPLESPGAGIFCLKAAQITKTQLWNYTIAIWC